MEGVIVINDGTKILRIKIHLNITKKIKENDVNDVDN